MTLPFDQYQRYKTAEMIISQIKSFKSIEKIRVIEIEANVQQNLGKLLPDEDITYLDINIPEEYKNNPLFIEGDATDLINISDKEYDIAVSLDVFEHIDPHKRMNYIKELNRVARYGAIFCAPYNFDYVSDAENRVNSFYYALYGEDYPWLKEHKTNGLPNLDETTTLLKNLHLQSCVFSHGDILMWEKMTTLHFLVCSHNNLLQYRTLIDKFYNEKIYQGDISDQCYRNFIFTSNDNKMVLTVEHYIASTLKGEVCKNEVENLDKMRHNMELLANIAFSKSNYMGFADELNLKTENVRAIRQDIEKLHLENEKLCQDYDALKDELNLKAENIGTICQDIEKLRQDYDALKQERKKAKTNFEQISWLYQKAITSKSWKITEPLRDILSLMHRVKQHIKLYKSQKKLKLTKEQVSKQKQFVFEDHCKISILVPIYNTPKKYLISMIKSVIKQTYPNWQLCIADASDENHTEVASIIQQFMAKDNRIKYKKIKNKNISDNTNECFSLADGEYITLLDHDDELTQDALFEVVESINRTHSDIYYSDEDKINAKNKRVMPFYKPDWSPDLLYTQMYICHLLIFKTELFKQIGGFDRNFSGSQDYDLILRLYEKTENIVHIPKILYSWRMSDTSTSINPGSKPYAHDAGREALNEHLKRKYGNYAHAENTDLTYVYDSRFDLLKNQKISIIIPTKDHVELLDSCVNSILRKTRYLNFEILILNNNSNEVKTLKWFDNIQSAELKVKVIDCAIPFNWSKLNNIGISKAEGEVFIFMNNDTTVISPDWLDRLSENALREEIGVVGPLLLYEDDTIQHAGVVVGMGGWADHVYKLNRLSHDYSPFVNPALNRNVLAVTGACMAVSRRVVEKIGLFNEEFVICGSDVEFCLRAIKNNLRVLYCSKAQLYHLESKTRDSFVPDIDFQMSEKHYSPYRELGDPYYNKNLDYFNTTPVERS